MMYLMRIAVTKKSIAIPQFIVKIINESILPISYADGKYMTMPNTPAERLMNRSDVPLNNIVLNLLENM